MMVAGMARLDMEAEGIDPGQAAVERARSLGLNVQCGLLHDAHFPDARFDSVSMYHVLEHTPDPVSMLAECRRILSPNGEIVVGVPNFGSLVRALVGSTWSAYDLPRHLHHFCTSSIKNVAARAGLTVVAMDTESLPEHVELELATWMRLWLKVPARLTLKTGVVRPLAKYLTNKGSAMGAVRQSSCTCDPRATETERTPTARVEAALTIRPIALPPNQRLRSLDKPARPIDRPLC